MNAALAVKIDGTRFVPRDTLETHLLKQSLEQIRLGIGEFHEFKTIDACRIFGTDFGGRRIVRKRSFSHPVLL